MYQQSSGGAQEEKDRMKISLPPKLMVKFLPSSYPATPLEC
jgi:hypothetical protein